MKTNLFFTVVFCGAVFANVLESKASLLQSEPLTETKVVKTYYGTQAVANDVNPCKGKTTRICGKVESDLQSITDRQTFVQETVFNAEDEIMSKRDYIVDKGIEEVRDDLTKPAKDFGGAIENN